MFMLYYLLAMLKKFKDNISRIKAKKDAPGVPKGDQYVVGLDIGTENVKALIGKIEGDDIVIVGSGRAHQELADMQAGAIADIASVVANCDEALTQAEKMAGVAPTKVVIGIAGELVKGTTTTVKFSRKQPDIALDMPEVLKIISLVQQKAEERAKKQLVWELGSKEIDIRMVNSALVSMQIDGYEVSSPLGFQGREVTVQLYTAFAPLVHIGALEKVAQELNLELVAVAAEPFAVARSVIGNNPNANTSAILMDVGGGTTDIAVLDDGGVEGTKMFGIGGRAFTKAIERDLDIDFVQAEALKLALETNKVPEHKRTAIIESLNNTLDVWIEGVGLALDEFKNVEHLPHHIMLCGGGASLDLLVERLEESTWYTEQAFTRKPTVHYIDPTQVAGITDTTGTINDHTVITAMGLLRVAADTIRQKLDTTSSGSMRERINKLLSI